MTLILPAVTVLRCGVSLQPLIYPSLPHQAVRQHLRDFTSFSSSSSSSMVKVVDFHLNSTTSNNHGSTASNLTTTRRLRPRPNLLLLFIQGRCNRLQTLQKQNSHRNTSRPLDPPRQVWCQRARSPRLYRRKHTPAARRTHYSHLLGPQSTERCRLQKISNHCWSFDE